jgi:hypothetical protein
MSIADPKLKIARHEIEAICKRYDIAGFFILHNAPGNAEHWMEVSPSYSRASMEGPGALRLRSKLADYDGDKMAQRVDMEATLNMLSNFAMIAGQAAIPLLEISQQLDRQMGAEHTPTLFEPDPPKGAH